MELLLICPTDHSALVNVGGALHCESCGRDYPLEDGIARFLPVDDPFYEGTYRSQVRFVPKSERVWSVWPLWLINSGYLWNVRKHVTSGATVVELGGASGIKYFAQRYSMVACDISRGSLSTIEGYAARIQTDAASCIPLADHSVDAVVSSYFWEHMSSAMKTSVLGECDRILKPGGKIIFLYDVETENPLIKRYRERSKESYERLFLDGDGHIGYETPSENIERFEAAGFRILHQCGMEKTHLQSASTYVKLAEFPGAPASLFGWLGRLESGWTFVPFTLFKRLVDTIVAPLLPANWARIEMVAAEKVDE